MYTDEAPARGRGGEVMATTFVDKIKLSKETIIGTVLTIANPIIAQLAGIADGEFVMIEYVTCSSAGLTRAPANRTS